MAGSSSFEKICTEVAEMTKTEVKKVLLHFPGKLNLDFTEEYLDSLSVDRLRHILLAALVVDKRKHA